MGISTSAITPDILNEYNVLTYLTKSEILRLYKLFNRMQPEGSEHIRLTTEQLEKEFPQLQVNPFKDQIYKVFSSDGGHSFTFEDLLDLCSVMSEKCPDNVKASWAFRIFDFDEDDAIGVDDIKEVIKRLTQRQIDEKDKVLVANNLMKAMDLEEHGSVGQCEFTHAVGKMTEFSSSFTFRF